MSNHVFDKSAWARMSLFEQMGNIGSEVGRALAAKHRGDEDSSRAALYRGLDLIDITVNLWRISTPSRNRELLRARELFVQSVTTETEDQSLENYFMQFAIAARLKR
jgi:hypothetical protein